MMGLSKLLDTYPDAVAVIRGSNQYKSVNGIVRFYQTDKGVIVAIEVNGLPLADGKCKDRIYALHIHEGEKCSGNEGDPFADALMHYNPQGCEHPYHAGDMPPLFGNNGYAMSVFITSRLMIEEIIGRTVIIHSEIDDFTSQPSGAAGTKIACGKIMLCRLR